ncbi:hypothetical protein PVL29_024796 [Vitis rotundifolia]|uniref:Thaumatin-like protein n=1 Tax=Vitis rotundifolia TaxID=103349 RepID=A0AA39D9I3_VITRO|nr:hypothetical protein PVL29_024796 [Vitis rotundifolia]
MIFSQLFSLKNTEENKRKGKRGGKFYRACGIQICIFRSGWSGRFWGRTWCNFDGLGSCVTGDCGSRTIECNNVDAASPATLAEFTLGTGGQDVFDVSLVDGCNLSMIVEGSAWSGMCTSTGCMVDLNQGCPAELKVGDGSMCRSACEAFGSLEYSCDSAYITPGLFNGAEGWRRQRVQECV